MTDFEALKRQAKEREEGVRKVFVNYDHDKSDSIDMMELTCLLDDLGLYEKIKTDKDEEEHGGAHRPRPPRRPRLGARARERGDTTWESGGRGVTVARVFTQSK